jgi:hydrogenase nickel incorporation protein HypB
MNGKEVGEIETRSALAGAFDTPVIFLSGDEAAAADLKAIAPEAETVAVKEGLSYYACVSMSAAADRDAIRQGAARAMKNRLRLGGLDGDIATERDATRLERAGIPARQILTGGACHLDARQVEKALAEEGERLEALDVLFIENVGNLICPTSYDLGEDFKVALLSVVEGDDKPFKYPAIFSKAAVTVITKADLLAHVDFDLDAVRQQIEILNPSARILVTSARSGDGMAGWFALLEEELSRKRPAAAAG